MYNPDRPNRSQLLKHGRLSPPATPSCFCVVLASLPSFRCPLLQGALPGSPPGALWAPPLSPTHSGDRSVSPTGCELWKGRASTASVSAVSPAQGWGRKGICTNVR